MVVTNYLHNPKMEIAPAGIYSYLTRISLVLLDYVLPFLLAPKLCTGRTGTELWFLKFREKQYYNKPSHTIYDRFI
jgi:hypothetical protein